MYVLILAWDYSFNIERYKSNFNSVIELYQSKSIEVDTNISTIFAQAFISLSIGLLIIFLLLAH